MKGLIKAIIIIFVLIIVGVGASAFVTVDLMNDVVVAHNRGFAEGHTRGYEEGWRDGSRDGYQDGSQVGYRKDNQVTYNGSDGDGFYFLYNPTYDELRGMLAGSKALNARELVDYAEINGIRAAYVRCQSAREASQEMVYIHELVAFETADKGVIIIEPWQHQEVKIEIGKSYSVLNGFDAPAYDDTITKITFVW